MSTLENRELNKYYTNLQEDVKSLLVSDEEGNTPEQIFTEKALISLYDAQEIESYLVKYDEKISKRGVEHKINAYAISDNYETVELFISIFNGTESLSSVTKTDAEKALEKLVKFFRNAVYNEYGDKVEESSQIFDFAQTLAHSPDLKEYLTRVNVYLLTDGEVKADIKSSEKIAGYTVFYKVIDINYLFNISEKSHIPIEIDFIGNKIEIPCIEIQTENAEYQSYLAMMPGNVLASLYEQYGSKLLEQNVRSFLQFTGKINKGIRKTIIEEPHMFLAFNNGLSVTADEVTIVDLPDGRGKAIGLIKDLQIVNGGQTTASIYHTWKKDKADISKIFVQLKLSKVNDKSKFSEIVSRISEYANTQNKVSVSDLSSNRPYHIELEKLSRTIWASPKDGGSQQTIWFYERARGQYNNARNKDGFTKSRLKAFDLKYPKYQVFTKEDLAKFINSYQEVYESKKLVIGPHIVVRGSQKNYVHFINYNLVKSPDSVYYEDIVAKMILFRVAEKTYGIKPNSIGDLRYITVPYSIAILGLKTDYKLDLYKIWKNQTVSDHLKKLLYELMSEVEQIIKTTAASSHGALYGEWGKKEECWIALKNSTINVDFSSIKSDLGTSKRQNKSDEMLSLEEKRQQDERVKSIPPTIWKKIEKWGDETEELSQIQRNNAFKIAGRLKNKSALSDFERESANRIIDIVIDKYPELLFDIDIAEESVAEYNKLLPKVDLALLLKLDAWNKKSQAMDSRDAFFMKRFVQNLWEPKGGQIKVIEEIVKRAFDKGFTS